MPSNTNAFTVNWAMLQGTYATSGYLATSSLQSQDPYCYVAARYDGMVLLRDAKGTELPYQATGSPSQVVLELCGARLAFERTNERDPYGRLIYVEAKAAAPEPVAQRRQIKLGGDV